MKINRKKVAIGGLGFATYIMYIQSGFQLWYLIFGYLTVKLSFFLKKTVNSLLNLVSDALWFCTSNL